MPKAPVPETAANFLNEPNFAVVASLKADGSPHSTVTWFDWEDGRVLLNMDDTRLRLRFLKSDPRVSITVIDRENPYRHVTVSGKVGEMYADEDLRDIDRLSNRYGGEDYPVRDQPRTTAWIEIDRWHGWDPAQADTTGQMAWKAD